MTGWPDCWKISSAVSVKRRALMPRHWVVLCCSRSSTPLAGSEVHQVAGMIAVQTAVGIVKALVLLPAHAHSNGRDIADVALGVVARQLRFALTGEVQT